MEEDDDEFTRHPTFLYRIEKSLLLLHSCPDGNDDVMVLNELGNAHAHLAKKIQLSNANHNLVPQDVRLNRQDAELKKKDAQLSESRALLEIKDAQLSKSHELLKE